MCVFSQESISAAGFSTAAEGNLYKDATSGKLYIGLRDGTLQEINGTLTLSGNQLTLTPGNTISLNLGFTSVESKTASYTLTSADNGKIIEFNSSSALTCTIPSTLSVGFQVSITQRGIGQVTFVGSGITLRNAYNFTKSAKQYSKVGIEIAFSGNEAILSGDMQ